jgi:hypothetical protein
MDPAMQITLANIFLPASIFFHFGSFSFLVPPTNNLSQEILAMMNIFVRLSQAIKRP